MGRRPGRPAPTGKRSSPPAGTRAGDRAGRRSPPKRGDRPAPTGRRRADRPAPTAAQRRAAEVAATRPPRPPRDPDAERAKIEARTVETWIDEGTLRDEAVGAAGRAAAPPQRPRAQRRTVDPDTTASIRAAVHDTRRAEDLTARLAQAQDALDHERFDEARRIATSLLQPLSNVAAVHEVIGLAAYRTGRWRQAATELELGQARRPTVELLPVLADVYRALHRWDDVERVWADVRAESPAQEVLAEARIVAAGAQLDRGDVTGALTTMQRAATEPKRVRDHHLRQWYVLADLHDRAGDPIEATRWFERIAAHDRNFVDVVDRLRALGRR